MPQPYLQIKAWRNSHFQRGPPESCKYDFFFFFLNHRVAKTDHPVNINKTSFALTVTLLQQQLILSDHPERGGIFYYILFCLHSKNPLVNLTMHSLPVKNYLNYSFYSSFVYIYTTNIYTCMHAWHTSSMKIYKPFFPNPVFFKINLVSTYCKLTKRKNYFIHPQPKQQSS